MRKRASKIEALRRAQAQRAADFVRRAWPDDTEKRLLAALSPLHERDVGHATAERIVYGQLLSQDSLNALANIFGRPFIEHVYQPLLGALSQPQKAWITESALHEAPAGHDIFVRDVLGMPPTATDHTRYALRNLGWIAVERMGDGSALLRHEDAVCRRALELAQDWLRTVAGRVTINQQDYPDAISAIAGLHAKRSATSAREAMLSAQDWSVRRQPIDAVASPPLVRFLTARREAGDAPGTLPRILSEQGLLPQSSLMRVLGDSVCSLWNGHKLGINPAEVMGMDLRARPNNKRYNELVRAHMLQAVREPDGTFHQLCGIRIGDYRFDYQRVAFADQRGPGDAQIVASAVVITKRERVTA